MKIETNSKKKQFFFKSIKSFENTFKMLGYFFNTISFSFFQLKVLLFTPFPKEMHSFSEYVATMLFRYEIFDMGVAYFIQNTRKTQGIRSSNVCMTTQCTNTIRQNVGKCRNDTLWSVYLYI